MNKDAQPIYRNLKEAVLRSLLAFADLLPTRGPAAQRLKCGVLRLTGMRIGQGSHINFGFRCITPQNIRIGDRVWIGHENRFWAYCPVSIGSLSMTARGVSIVAASHDPDSFEPLASQSVAIGRGCWIGANATIVGGSCVGDGAVIGAGALVVGSIPPLAIAVGVPAKVIKYRTPPSDVWSDFGHYNYSALVAASGGIEQAKEAGQFD
jgi:acetyltransferase-like isoleucine patch superfamily enzyme